MTKEAATMPANAGVAAARPTASTPSLHRISSDILIYAVGYGLAKLGSFLALPVLTRAFSPADYGVLSSVTALMWLVIAAGLLGGDSVYGRHFFEARTDAERRVLTSTWVGFLSLWSLGLILVLSAPISVVMQWYLGGGHLILVIATLATVPPMVLNMMCAQVLRNQLRRGRLATLAAVEALVSTGLGLLLGVALHRGLGGVATGNLIGEIAVLPVYLWTARSMFAATFSGRLLGELVRFGASLVPLSIAYWVFLTSDRLLLGRLSTFHELGLYSVAVQVALVLNLLQGVVSQAWTPHAMRAWLQVPDEAAQLSGRFMTYLAAGFGLVAVALAALSPALLRVLASGAYLAGARDVGPLVLGGVCYASIQVTSLGVTIARRSGFLAMASIGAAVLNVALNIALDGRMGGLGAAWATAISYGALTVAYLLRSQRLHPVAYEWRRMLSIAVVTVGLVLAATSLGSRGDLGEELLTALACVAAYPTCLFLLRAFDTCELAVARSVVSRQ